MLMSFNKGYLLGYLIIATVAVVVTGCGGGGSGDDSPALPELSIDSPAISEGNSGTTVLSFAVNLDQTDTADVSVDFATADDNASADSANAGSDYDAVNGSITIPAGSTSATIEVVINGDTDVEGDETFLLNLSNISSNATLGTATATSTILNDDVVAIPSSSALNDTGVTTCSDDFNNGLDCNSSSDGTDQFPGQDAEHGHDVTDNDDTDGHAGFVFSKLDSNGFPLVDQSADYATTPWSCVLDERSNKMWEVKTADGNLHDNKWIYSWYNSSGINDGGEAGASNGGQCVNTHDCDTEKFVLAVNATQLCGFDDWELATRHELISLMHFGASAAPYIDSAYFINHAQLPYWSSSPATDNNVAYVNYSEFGAHTTSRYELFAVRLVRGGE